MRVESVDDPRVADYRNVRDRDLQRRDGLFMVEGRENLRRLLAESPYRPRSLLLSAPAHAALGECIQRLAPEAPVFVASREVLHAVAGFDVHRGCLAACERGEGVPPESVLAAPGLASTVLVLEGLANPDNVGSLFRNAQAFGTDAVLLCPRCCDPLYRKAIRVSMGAALCVPTARFSAWPDGLERLRGAGYRILALDPAPHALEVSSAALRERAGERVALVVGTEGVGLSSGVRDLADLQVRIDMVDGFDSINVATAGALALHRLFLARQAPPEARGA